MSENAHPINPQPVENDSPGGKKPASREQEGWARSLSVPEGVVPTCSSYFCAYEFTLNDFRGTLKSQAAQNRIHEELYFADSEDTATQRGDLGGGTPLNPPHKDRNFVEWETSLAEAAETTVFTWIGGSQLRPSSPAYPNISATLFINGKASLQFPLGRHNDWSAAQDGITLTFESRRFQSLVEIPHRTLCPDGVSGFYHLQVPGNLLQTGQPLKLRVALPPQAPGREEFFFVSPRADALKVDLTIVREELSRLQQDVIQLRQSHEQLYAQFYPELFPQRINGNRSIVHQDQTNHLHPATVSVMRDGEVVVTAREATDHLANDGRMIMRRSRDNGQSWEPKEVLYDLGKSDHRCAPIFEAPSGEWLTTDYRAGGEYTPEGVWSLKDSVHGPTLWGAWSGDRGKTWEFSEKPLTVPGAYYEYAEAERHMIRLPSGRLLVGANYVEVGPDGGEPVAGVYRIAVFSSDDNARSWEVLSHLPYHPYTIGEPTLLQTKSGKITLLSRTQWGGEGGPQKGGLLQADSFDDGASWSEWRQTGMSSMGSPGHLLQLQDGRILCTHASRLYPGSIYVTLSSDEGTTWDTDNTRIVANDVVNFDACYPTSGQMADGNLITVWYANLFGKFFISSLTYAPENL